MPKVSRLTDIGSGHGCFPPSPATEGSGDVFVNGLPAHRRGDALQAHACPSCPPHGRTSSGGSPTVYVNGKALVRMGDSISCGGALAAGSSDVFADEQTPRMPKAVFAAGGPCVRDCMKSAARRGKAFVG
jgi:uncharacterized Zn-binding protein involved in type VI secretion